jgi:hypothetical protein
MITIKHIDKYIELKNSGRGIGGHSQRPAIFKDISKYNQLDELFSRMVLEKNTKVSDLISNKTKQLISNAFDSKETCVYFKNYVNCFKLGQKYNIEKPWWKFWVKKTNIQ